MANSLEEPASGLAYIATDSLGGRRWKADGNPVDTRPSFNGVYIGFSQTQLKEVEFVSATSGAIIRAEKKATGRWIFRFKGADIHKEGRESGYATLFESLQLKELSKSLPFEAEWAKSAYWK